MESVQNIALGGALVGSLYYMFSQVWSWGVFKWSSHVQEATDEPISTSLYERDKGRANCAEGQDADAVVEDVIMAREPYIAHDTIREYQRYADNDPFYIEPIRHKVGVNHPSV